MVVSSTSSQQPPHETDAFYNKVQAAEYPSPRPRHDCNLGPEFSKVESLPSLSLGSNLGYLADAAVICESQLEEYPLFHGEIAMQQIQPSESQSTGIESANIESSAKKLQQPSMIDHSRQEELPLNLNADFLGFSQPHDLINDDFFDIPADMLLPNFASPEHTFLTSKEIHILQQSPSVLSEMSDLFEDPTPTREFELNRTIFQQLPTVLHKYLSALPNQTFDDTKFDILCKDITSCLGHDSGLHAFVSFKGLQRFLMTYVDCFHRHLPLLHLPSISFGTTPSPLIISICCIGALYRRDRKRARLLYELADRLLVNNCQSSSQTTGNNAPTWSIQARVIINFYSVFGGSREIRASALNHIGWFTLQYRHVQNSLMDTSFPAASAWSQWIERESKRRLLCAIYIMSNLVVTTFGVTPGFVNSSDLQSEAPEEETLWNALRPDVAIDCLSKMLRR